MSSRRTALMIGLFAPILGGGALIAAESQSGTSSAISAVQQEFKSFQSPKQLPMSGAEKLELPSINHSQMSESPAPPLISPLKREQLLEQQQKDKKSKNWLVDAVLNPADKSKVSDAEMPTNKAGDPSLDPFEKLIAEQQQRDPKANELAARETEERQSELAATTVNPLTTYMAGWISPRDRELLAGNAPSASAGGHRPVGPSWESSPSMAFRKLDKATLRLEGESAFRAGLSTEKYENPYLVTSDPAVAHSATSPTPADPFSPLVEHRSTPRVEPSPPTAAESKPIGLPGLNRQEEDARYFPQLKRF